MSATAFEAQLASAVGPQGLRGAPEDLLAYGTDRCRGPWTAAPRAVVLPQSVAQVQEVVRVCAAHGVAIVPSGGRTGLCGGAAATAGEVVLSLDRMTRVLDVDVGARVLRCEAGATVEAVQIAAASAGLMYPVDFAAKGSAQIGGSIATNAGGVRVLRYGSTRAWVSGLVVVVASGERLDLGGALVKDNTGYDLRQLFIGAEGTLGVIVEATLRLTRPPDGGVVALCAVPGDAAILELFSRVQGSVTLQAFECLDHACLDYVQQHRGRSGAGPFATPSAAYVLIEAELAEAADELDVRLAALRERLTRIFTEAAAAGVIDDAVVATSTQQARELWALREDISESLHRHRPHKNDVALPVSRVAQFAARWRQLAQEMMPGARALCFGHVGDGNLHLNLIPPAALAGKADWPAAGAYDDAVYALVEDFGGSISAEHGIGLLKRSHLRHSRSAPQLEAMRAIKQALDPAGLFNPGKILG